MSIKKIEYTEARKLIRSGDILLWSPTSLAGRLIGWATRSYRGRAAGPDCQLSHAGMASWSAPACDGCGSRRPINDALEVLEQHESLQGYGTRTTSLSWMVEHYPGSIHVYRVNDASDTDSYIASRHMRRRAGTPYGWWGSLFRTGVRVFLRWLYTPAEPFLVSHEHRLDCSASVADSWRRVAGGRYDPKPKTAVWAVKPVDLADPAFATYLFTLYPD